MIPKHSQIGYEKFSVYKKVGDHSFQLPDPPPIDQIENVYLPKSEQYFRPVKFPKDFHRWSIREQEEFEDRELDRIEDGFWFFNNGNLEYITGIHYFYITYWTIKMLDNDGYEQDKEIDLENFKLGGKTGGKKRKKKKIAKRIEVPNFIDVDRDFFLLWEYVEQHPLIGGLVFVTNRRDGKSYKGGVIAYLSATLNEEAIIGIQSKTDKDAKSVLKKVVDAWKRLPYIFKPDDNGELNPQKALKFQPPSRKDTKSTVEEREGDLEYINSEINYGPVSEFHYDGQDLRFYMMDEAGKTIKADVYETQQVVKETLVDGSELVGKMYVTSTVEEMTKKGGGNLYKIWKDSDHKKKAHGMTISSLIRYFKPAYMGFRGKDDNGVAFINKYGYSDAKRAKAYLEEKRSILTGDRLLSYMRKYPFTEDEAFQQGLVTCWFNEENINRTLKYNDHRVNEDNLWQGNFEWSSESSEYEVEFHEHPEGRWMVSWLPPVEWRNSYSGGEDDQSIGYQRYPTSTRVVGGVDPFDNKETTDGRKSDGAVHFFRKFDPMAPNTESNCFVAEYIHRPESPQIFRNDVLKAAIFYSAMLLVEKNKYGIITHFEEKGFLGYLMRRPDPTHTEYSARNTKDPIGIPMSGEYPREYLVNTLANYIYKYIGFDEKDELKTFMPFNRTLEDWKVFNPMKWTDYDATVSSGLALMAAETTKIKYSDDEVIAGLLVQYDQSGSVSKVKFG